MFTNDKDMIRQFPKINQEDPYVWVDFMLEFRPKFESMKKLSDAFVKQYPKVLAQIQYGTPFFLKKDTQTDLFTRIMVPKFTMSFTETIFVKGFMSEKTVFVDIEDLLRINQNRLPLYSKETFKPMDHKLIQYEYNTWTGFKADVTDFKMEMDQVNPILDFIKKIISNNDPKVYAYFMSWLRHIVVHPYRKTEVAVFLHSDEKGTGKGTLGYWLKNYLFGSHLSTVVCGLSKVAQKHNTCIQKKIFVMVDEIPATHGEFHAQFDTMKHLITDPETTVEPKGVDPYEIPNMVNFLMLSNNLLSIKIEKGDRRYACFEVSEKMKGDEEYWDYIHNEVLTEETAKHFFLYLKNYDETKLVSLRKIPNTELRDKMIANSVPSHERFFMDIKTGDYEIPKGAYIGEFTSQKELISDAFKAEVMYRLYETYCNSRKENCIKFRLFYSIVNDKFVNKKTVKIDGKSMVLYRII